MLAGTAVGAVAVGLGLPRNLLGSAPPDPAWRAVAGQVRVVDGETLRLGERVVRLHGLRAPARGENCAAPGGDRFDCGAAAAERLAGLVLDRAVECRLRGRDSFHRALGVCVAGETELNAALVAAGYALADGEGTPDLAQRETEARSGRQGLWAASGPPSDWQSRR